MKRGIMIGVAVLVLLGIGFIAGRTLCQKQSTNASSAGARKILYYVDPMNPSHTSDKPGLAPCGMKMEPVYADSDLGSAPAGPVQPGTIKLNLEKQQLIGIRTGVAERKAAEHTLRLLGKVEPDATRIFQVTAPAEGWVTKTMPLSVGSTVKKDETLALMYSPTFISAGLAFRNALEYQDRFRTNKEEGAVQRPGMADFNVKQYADSLRNLGVSDRQINDMIQTRKYSEHIDVVAPADGFISSRNISPGQRFERGAELYRVVDLSRVWVVADVFNREAPLIPAGVKARISVPSQNAALEGTLSEALPQFDQVTRTLKLRFEAENPGYVLKPDMFVDVEFTIRMPESLVVPAEAVLDSGMRKTVFVDRGQGFFEPRTIETGWRIGDSVQVLRGLMAGERIVVSGNFLLDSESRMKLAASGVHTTPQTDPVCGMAVDETIAKSQGRFTLHENRTYFFCNDGCKEQFTANPAQFLKGAVALTDQSATAEAKSIDPVCSMKVTESKARASGRFSEYQGNAFFFCNMGCKEEFDRNPAQFVKASPAAAGARAHSDQSHR